MRIQRVKFLPFVLAVMAFLAMSQVTVTAEEPAPLAGTGAENPAMGSSMTISDLVSASNEFSNRLSSLQRNLELGFDIPSFEQGLADTEERAKVLSNRLKEMKTDGRLGYERLSSLKAEIAALERELEKTWRPFADRIAQVERWGQEWSESGERLKALEASLPRDESYKTMRPTIGRATETIDQARKLISGNLKSMLATENKASGVQSMTGSLVSEVESLLQGLRGDLFQRSATALFSAEYFAQFKTIVGDDLRKGFQFASHSQGEILQRNAVFIVLQMILWLTAALLIIRNRAALVTEPRLQFIAERPFSAGVMIGFVIFVPFYEPGLGVWRVVIIAIASLSIARLSGCCIVGAWRRGAVYGLVLAFIVNEFLQLSELPQPLFRLYVSFVSLVGLFLCLWRLVNMDRGAPRRLYRWALWGGIVGSGMILATNVSGYSALASHVLEASLRTVLLFLLGWILMASVRGGLARLSKSAYVMRVPLLQKNAVPMVHVSSRLFDLVIGGSVVTYLLVSWGLYDEGSEALQSVLSIGLSLGSWRVNIGHLVVTVLCLYGSILISRAVQSILAEEVFPRQGVERGVQLSMGRLIHYAILLVGFLLALAALGVNFTNITIIGGALGVGIGFGLQTIVNNFVSGIILLFERPVRVGDYVEVGGLWAEIKKIGLRATVVETFDRADVVVPNSDFISNQVTNWTRTNRIIRLKIPVGVAYGSDVQLVMKILLECGEDNPSVVSTPNPLVFFRGFGESSLDFELRVHILDIDNRNVVLSEILQEIDRQFREAGVEIPFPQRDLHVRSVDEAAGKGLLGENLSSSPNLTKS